MRKTSKYTAEQNSQIKVEILSTLTDNDDYMTIDQIQHSNIYLASGATVQKIARVLSELAEMGVVTKTKFKSSQKMMYKVNKETDNNEYLCNC